MPSAQPCMDIDPIEAVEVAKESTSQKHRWLNPAVAITVALLATFMGICKVKDDNIVQAMQQAQADKLDHWQFYQARNIRAEIAKSTLVQLELQKITAQGKLAEALDTQIAMYQKLAQEQDQKKVELKAQAEQDQINYDALNFKDDQFDLSDASIAIAIAMLAVASLTELPWLFFLALLPSGYGFFTGLSGLLGWGYHPEALIKLLS
jgi:hypothetical protein